MEFRGLTIVILNWGDLQERDFDEWGFFRQELHQKGIKGEEDGTIRLPETGDCRDYMGVVLPGPSLADFAPQLAFK